VTQLQTPTDLCKEVSESPTAPPTAESHGHGAVRQSIFDVLQGNSCAADLTPSAPDSSTSSLSVRYRSSYLTQSGHDLRAADCA